MTDRNNRPCMLIILDGWGINPSAEYNAVAAADTPCLDKLEADRPVTRLLCSGEAVGLPPGIMGNSEVGHLNIGAGRVVFQDLLRIDQAIADAGFFNNTTLRDAMSAAKSENGTLHLMGLVSDGGVHSQLSHLLALLDMARLQGVKQVAVHAITDGRDTSPTGGAGYIQTVQDHIHTHRFGAIASICGRYYAMDRDKRWDRVERAYRLYTQGIGHNAHDPVSAIHHAYEAGETDEFIKPIVLTTDGESPVATIEDGDAVIFFNFRADRAREITRALTDTDFAEFDRVVQPRLSAYVTMTLYDETFTLPVAFPPVHLSEILGEVVSKNGLKQLRIAETEKYAHVTYFFNGGEETPFPGEDRCLIPSPRDVATYDQKPEMSAPEVTEEVLKRIRSDQYDFIVLNFANMDMVGHSGVQEAAVKACETVDRCLARSLDALGERKGSAVITADHGNAEMMADESGSPHTAHTLNPVKLILVDDRFRNAALKEGKLADIAPTILALMGLEKPKQMTGISLIP